MRSTLPLALAVMLGMTAVVNGEDSNQKEVRAKIAKGGWHVYYGEKITEAEYAGISAAVAASVATENPAPVLKYLEDYVDRTVTKLKGKAPELTATVLRELVEKAITTKGGSAKLGKVDVKFGIATYKRWQRVVYHEPRTRQVRKEKKVLGKTIVWHEPEVYMEKVEKIIPLPNWHDPYIGIRVR